MTTVIVDSEGARAWVPFAKNKLAQIKEMGLMAKTLVIDGYTISMFSLDEIEKIRITSPRGTRVFAGIASTYAIDRAGRLWAWGANPSGELGLGDNTNRLTPTQVGNDAWSSISSGTELVSNTFGIKTDGSLWVVGQNKYGILGLGGTGDVPRNIFAQVSAGPWKEIYAGKRVYGLALLESGTAYRSGDTNSFGLGTGAWAPLAGTWERLSDTCKEFLFYTCPHSLPYTWRHVSIGFYMAAAIADDGTLWTIGLNDYGGLGLGDIVNRPTDFTQVGADKWAMVAVGQRFMLGIKTDGTLWAWGSNASGQLGLGDTVDRLSPVQVGVAPWYYVSCRLDFAVAIRMDHTLWSWGRNSFGELGLGDTADRLSPTRIVGPPFMRADVAPGIYR